MFILNFNLKNIEELEFLLSMESSPLGSSNVPSLCSSLIIPNENAIGKVDLCGYTICDELGKTSDVMHYISSSKTFVVVNKDLCTLHTDFNPIAEKVANVADLSNDEAAKAVDKFFTDKKLLVLPSGFQGKIYSLGRYAQNTLPTLHTHTALAASSTTGIKGMALLAASPLLFVSTTYIGGMFFSSAGAIIGDNIYGKSFASIGWFLNRPMAGVECIINRIVLDPISSIVGIPLILNATKEQSRGFGISPEDVGRIAENAKKQYGKRILGYIGKKLGFNVTFE